MKKRFVCLLLTLVMLVSLIPAASVTASAAAGVSEAGIKVIKNYKGFHSTAYAVDAAGTEYRIGYGTPGIKGQVITEANADKYLREALDAIYTMLVAKFPNLVQKRYDALAWYCMAEENTDWISSGSALASAVNANLTGSDFVNVICNMGFTGGYPATAAANSRVLCRMAIANMYLNGVYGSASTGSMGYTVFDAGEGTFGSAKMMLQAYDCSQANAISVTPPTNGSKTFLGWYNGNALITGLGSATNGKTLTAHWQDGDQEVAASYTIPASLIYAAASISDTDTCPVMSDPSGSGYVIDRISRDATVTVAAEKIVSGVKWLRLSTGGWVKLNAAGTSLDPTIVTNKVVTITDDYVNIRKAPSVTAEKVGVAKRGETRTIVMVSGDWGYCSQGWIFLAYTDYSDKPTTDSTGTPIKGTGTPGKIVGAAKVNIRSAAGVGNALVTQLAQGTAVTVYEQTTVSGAAWGHIDQGWVSMQYVQLDKSAANSNVTAGTVVVVSSTSNLNVRSGPGTEYSKIGTLAPGTKVTIRQKQTVGGVSWALVDQGWINMNYVTTGVVSSGASVTGIGGTVVNCATGVNIRSAAGTTSALVGVAALGSRVTVTERVQVNGHYWGHIANGWVCMDYIKLDSEWNDQTPSGNQSSDIVTSFEGYPATINASNPIPVYASANSDSKVLMRLDDGSMTDIYITDRAVSGTRTFGKVTIRNVTGWVNLDDVLLIPVNAKVTAAKADAYEEPNTRSVFYASLVKDTYVTVGNSDGSGWKLADGVLWGQITLSGHTAWIRMSDVTMFKENTLPTGITTYSGVGYMTGTVKTASPVYADYNGNVDTSSTAYTLANEYKVNIQARNYDKYTGTTYGKVTVGSVTGWINMNTVSLDPVVMQAAAEVTAYHTDLSPAPAIPTGSRITVVNRMIDVDSNEINHGISDWGLVYVGDITSEQFLIRLDDGKVSYTTVADKGEAANPSVQTGVVVSGVAQSGTTVYEETSTASVGLLYVNSPTNVTILNWKNVGGITWGKVQIGQVVGWVNVATDIDFSGLQATVVGNAISAYSDRNKASSVQVLRVNERAIDIKSLTFDGTTLWGEIEVASFKGYIDLAAVALNTPGASYSPELVIASGRVNSFSAYAYLAWTPGSSSHGDVVTLVKDTTVHLTDVWVGSGYAWWKVDLDDKDGWTPMEFLSFNPTVVTITQSSAPIYNDLLTIGTGYEEILYTLYRNETITVTDFRLINDILYGQVSNGTTYGWIQITDASGYKMVGMMPGTAASSSFNNNTGNNTAGNTGTGTQTAAPAAQGTAAYIVCNTVVNVRSMPDPTSQLVTTLANGTPITITEQTTYIGKGWAHIAQGWVCMDYVKLGTAPAAAATTQTGNGNVSIMTTVPSGAIAVGYANEDLKIRTGAGLGYPEAGSVKKGNSVVIYENILSGGMSWGRTDLGWVCTSYLTITGIGATGSGNTGTISRCNFAVNVRDCASSAGAQMAKVMITSRVVIRETAIGTDSLTWGRTDLGWILMDYVVMDSAAAASSAAAATPTATTPTTPVDDSVG